MKKFVFPLDRALDWRRSQARREEIKLELLYAELRALDASVVLLNQEREAAETGLRARPAVDGQELAALHMYQEHTVAERARIAQARRDCERRIAAQMKALVAKRRDTKLLEILKERRMAAWSQEAEREIAQQAEESHLAKWNRRNIQ